MRHSLAHYRHDAAPVYCRRPSRGLLEAYVAADALAGRGESRCMIAVYKPYQRGTAALFLPLPGWCATWLSNHEAFARSFSLQSLRALSCPTSLMLHLCNHTLRRQRVHLSFLLIKALACHNAANDSAEHNVPIEPADKELRSPSRGTSVSCGAAQYSHHWYVYPYTDPWWCCSTAQRASHY